MPDVLIYADTVRSPELRHEVPMSVGDPFLYVERDGTRHIVISSMEIPLVAALGGYELHPLEEFGLDELRRSGKPSAEILDEIVVRAVESLGVESAVVPATFPLLVADRLRAAGVELEPEHEVFDRRRRVKSGAELAGIRRAQTAAEAGMAVARGLLGRAHPNGDGLEVDGEPLTSELLRVAIRRTVAEHGATSDVLVVAHGPQAAIGHHLGEGTLRAGEPVVIDLWPRDDASACSADMTRTFVVGDVPDEIADWHRHCKDALDHALARIRPGVTARSVFDASCEIFEAGGYATQRTKVDGEPLTDGFVHSLGHGVGLEVHEEPLLGMAGHDELVAGDVIAVEPGLYRAGFGGLRLEDLVLVTEDGAENLTRFPYELEP
jgi:Xaa-Pro aminopeptidase